jgi:glycosyltransferase involved in cell wall biosynthesis
MVCDQAMNPIFIFESHPVQYKAPVYQELARLMPDAFEVIYATDASMRPDNVDVEFGEKFAWDVPLLQGYPHRILGNETRIPFGSPDSLSGRGVFRLLKAERPRAIVLTSMRYNVDKVAYVSALALRIPILVRQETQDQMHSAERTWLKSALRFLAYVAIYAPVRHAFAFGVLNSAHLRRHGISADRISFARFSVPNAYAKLSSAEKLGMREELRAQCGVSQEKIVLGFCGKLIPKKNPALVFEALSNVTDDRRKLLHLLFVGSGQLEPDLKKLAARAEAQWGVKTTFSGFVNQSQLAPYYLAMDILHLPSRWMGEAWGLVVNEALNAGCGVVMSEAVGCHPEFSDLERVRVIKVDSASDFSKAIVELSVFTRDFDWAAERMNRYSSRSAAEGIRRGLESLWPAGWSIGGVEAKG